MTKRITLALNGDTTATLTIDDAAMPNRVTDIHIQGSDIKGNDLREIRIGELLQRPMPDMKTTKLNGRARLDDRFLAEVAAVYNTAIDNRHKPVVEVCKAYDIKPRTASYWIKKCKNKKLLKDYFHSNERVGAVES